MPAAPFFGNEGPAIDACLEDVRDLDFAPDRSIYLLARTTAQGVPNAQALARWQVRKGYASDSTIHQVLSGGLTSDPATVDFPEQEVSGIAFASDYTTYLLAARLTVLPSGGVSAIGVDGATIVAEWVLAAGRLHRDRWCTVCTPDDLTNGTMRLNYSPSEKELAVGIDGTPHVISSVSSSIPTSLSFPTVGEN